MVRITTAFLDLLGISGNAVEFSAPQQVVSAEVTQLLLPLQTGACALCRLKKALQVSCKT